MDVKIEASWKEQLQDQFSMPYFKALTDFVRQEYATTRVFPPAKLIFNAFDHCSFNRVEVVIVGQDPYHQPGQANGLSFSVNDGVRVPPSLVNIYKEISNEFDTPIPTSGNLVRWSEQGVLLLNATLTVRANQPGSHQNRGWEIFTDAVIDKLAKERRHLVFMLWGSYAQRKGENIDENRHLVLKSPHPSPFSVHRGFFGNNHFIKANEYLQMHDKKAIEW